MRRRILAWVLVTGTLPGPAWGQPDPDLPEPADAPPAVEAPETAPGRLSFEGLAPGDRVEVDGLPVDDAATPVEVEAGTHVVSYFPAAAPPVELYVEVAPGAHRVVRLAAPPPAALPRARSAGPAALFGSAGVAALASAGFWLLSERSEAAAEVVATRTDLTPEERRAVLDDLAGRADLRRSLAVGAGAAALAAAVAGAVWWAADGEDAPPVQPTAGPGLGLGLKVTFP